MKKFTAWALCIALILTLVQAPVQAAAPDNPSKHAFDNKIIKGSRWIISTVTFTICPR
ncbi:hypothetical protein GCM10007416_08580 [Kroppenstedtia guangzhouensis]|uniref:Uncharacterized protein n=1 Tax=Kroppenstedtia guangzhouensis TaxID=1274356 RepID=A0ABQ1G6Z1_9BACL|nr:hypothetical protein GCM10007416_08580 [Kroppenstedtia guangzhouensis]